MTKYIPIALQWRSTGLLIAHAHFKFDNQPENLYTVTLAAHARRGFMSALCHELTWPTNASRGGVARWKGWER